MKSKIFFACVVVGAAGGLIKCGLQDDSVRDKNWFMHLLAGALVGVFAGVLVAELIIPSGPDSYR